MCKNSCTRGVALIISNQHFRNASKLSTELKVFSENQKNLSFLFAPKNEIK